MIASAAAPRLSSDLLLVMEETRRRTLALVECVSDEDLERVHSPLMSPLVWDLGHIAAFEDLWLVHRHGGRPLLREDLAVVYDAFETPRAQRGELPMLDADGAREYLTAVRERTLEAIDERGANDGHRHEMVLRHEQQHNETMLQTLQLAALEGYRLPGSSTRSETEPAASSPSPFEMVLVEAGPCTLGAADDVFAYDNERPRHTVEPAAFRIGVVPVANGDYLAFVHDGGYRRREWWSEEGWAWMQQAEVSRPGGWTEDLTGERWVEGVGPLDPARPVTHVSWFEAEAFAGAHGARLPSETEWEKAATWDADAGAARPYPWGVEPPRPGVHANVDRLEGRPERVGAFPAGRAPSGCLGMIGDVWEWTSSRFGGYPGFVADPYPEYSEVFFGSEYQVLRGGSWATCARVATPAFRNWDFPQRRQIFSGFRLARDL